MIARLFEGTCLVTFARAFDLHDIRAEVGQHHRAVGAGEHTGEVNDAEAV